MVEWTEKSVKGRRKAEEEEKMDKNKEVEGTVIIYLKVKRKKFVLPLNTSLLFLGNPLL